ncbi:DHA2 family efflux MFS transporter permease subunit [Rubrobacter marinus]|uniref:DHA2 family efflux MFS transporter permease subunit n=1 Tax=Rubrobacter marinus TaxID=2653852 RepID=A0A6G8PZV3_9ACTN|nr:MDR family MFS transporter [Rubrobacter marinus]QIN79698.1 DHA2 family efflux MFS transporter permease subunit [Rubrobacter marinus]
MSEAERRGTAGAGGRRATLLAVAGLMLALFLVALDQTIVGTALPQIIADLQGFERYAWVTTAYLLASTAMIPVIGKLGDIYGRKWFILGGILVFLVGSALCGAAWGMLELIIFRGIQGLGAGMIFANIFTSVADIFPDPARRAKYQGVFFGVFALSSVVGPALGGWITDNLDWRWVFYVNLPLGLFSLLALPFALPQSTKRRSASIDYPGAVTITASVVALLLALSWVGEGYDWGATRVVWGFVVSAALLAAFVPLELRAREPIIPLSLFGGRVFATASVLMFLVGLGMFGIILYTPLFVQGVLGETATNSGTVLTPLVLSMTAVGVIGGQIIARVRRVKPFTLLGTVVMTFGTYLLTTLDTGSSTFTVAVFLAVTGLGLGLIMPTVTLAVQSTVPVEILGVATSATQFIRSLGSTVGTAVVGSLVTRGYAEDLAANAPAQAPERLVSALDNPQALVNPEAREALSEAASAFPGGGQVVEGVVSVARDALSGSIHDGFVFVFAAVGASILAALVMRNVRLEDAPGVASPTAARPAAETAASPPLHAPEPSVVPRLAEAFGRDRALSARDEALRGLLSSVNGMHEPAERRRASAALLSLAERIERGNGDYPNLVRAASELANGHGGTERERAVHASRRIVRPLRERLLREGLGSEPAPALSSDAPSS